MSSVLAFLIKTLNRDAREVSLSLAGKMLVMPMSVTQGVQVGPEASADTKGGRPNVSE